MNHKIREGHFKRLYIGVTGFIIVFLAGCDWGQPCVSCQVDVESLESHKKFKRPPPSFKDMADVKEKKKAFFGYLSPMIDKANREVLVERTKLLAIVNASVPLGEKDAKFVDKMCKKYRQKCEIDAESVKINAKAIALKIGTVPPSMALAQSANESAWGTSRFALDGNNFFGQWCFVKGCGLVPSSRNKGASHEVRAFDSAMESVRGYVLNLNTTSAYRHFRSMRASFRDQGQPLKGTQLVEGLDEYSERGEAYIHEIRSMIRSNKLSVYDDLYWQNLGAWIVAKN